MKIRIKGKESSNYFVFLVGTEFKVTKQSQLMIESSVLQNNTSYDGNFKKVKL